LENGGLDARLLDERAIEMDGRTGEPAQARSLDAPAVGEVGLERVERPGDREDAIFVERNRTFENEVARRRREVIVVSLEADGGRLASLRRLLDAHVHGRAEERNGMHSARQHVSLELELEDAAGDRTSEAKAAQREASLGARRSLSLRDPPAERFELAGPRIG